MLVLSRHVGESIWIDGTTKITILSVAATGRIRIGIEGPAVVHREEVQRMIERFNDDQVDDEPVSTHEIELGGEA